MKLFKLKIWEAKLIDPPIDYILSLKQRCSNANTCVCYDGFMGPSCDMIAPVEPEPTRDPNATPDPDEVPSATISHTHIRKLFLFC